MDMKLEVVVVPVFDVDQAKDFYQALGWRLDADFVTGADFRVVQLTPPARPARSSSAPGSPSGPMAANAVTSGSMAWKPRARPIWAIWCS